MTAHPLSNGAGMEIIDPHFRTLGRLALKIGFRIPPPLRETLLFGRSRICFLPLQKLLVSALESE